MSIGDKAGSRDRRQGRSKTGHGTGPCSQDSDVVEAEWRRGRLHARTKETADRTSRSLDRPFPICCRLYRSAQDGRVNFPTIRAGASVTCPPQKTNALQATREEATTVAIYKGRLCEIYQPQTDSNKVLTVGRLNHAISNNVITVGRKTVRNRKFSANKVLTVGRVRRLALC